MSATTTNKATKRDQFASHALRGMLANMKWGDAIYNANGGMLLDQKSRADELARRAYLYADAMMDARSEE